MQEMTLNTILSEYTTAKHGLFLLDLPTGFGKTYATLATVRELLRTTDRKVIFLTTLKKNLPHKEFRERLESEGAGEELGQEVLFLDSYIDHLFENWEELSTIIPESIAVTSEFKTLRERIEMLRRVEQKGEKSLAEEIRTQISRDIEPAFRRFLKEQVRSLHKTVAGRLQKVRLEHAWIPRFYPSVLSHEKRVLFMSLDKFLTKNDPLTQSSHDFFDPTFLQNALIIMDEFDAGKETLLRNIIRENLRRKVDVIGLVRSLQDAFLQHDLPAMLTENAPLQQDESSLKVKKSKSEFEKNIPALIAELQKRLQKLSEDHALRLHFKTAERSGERRFLFHDWEYKTITKEGKGYIYIEADRVARLNRIIFQNTKSSDGKKPVWLLLSDIERFLRHFVRQIDRIALNYQQNRVLQSTGDEPQFSLDAARRTFLNALDLPFDYQDFLLELAFQQQNMNSPVETDPMAITRHPTSRRFYEEGYRYYAFEDSDLHDAQSKIYVVSVGRTPESLLAGWAEQNLVLGISATAKIQTVVGNFDLQYLKVRLGTHFQEISTEERESLRVQYERQNAGYDKIVLKTDFIHADGNHLRKTLEKLFPGKETWVNSLLTALDTEVKADLERTRTYYAERVIRVAKAFDEFVKEKNCHSFLCFLNAHPKPGSDTFPLKTLEAFFKKILKKHGLDEKAVEWEVLASGNNFDSKKEELLNWLAEGKKVFVMTTYATLGAGQNMQYALPPDVIDLIRLPYGRPEKAEKDFDGIYLDKPTNLLVNLLADEINDEDLNRRIFQVEMLAENGDLSYEELRTEIHRTFKFLLSKNARFEKGAFRQKPYDTHDFRQLVLRIVIQAVGRIGRTPVKASRILLLAESELASYLRALDTQGMISSPEMLALHQASGDFAAPDTTDFQLKALANRAVLVNRRTEVEINRLAFSDLSRPENRHDWLALREMVLRHPTLDAAGFASSSFAWAYVELPQAADRCFFKSDSSRRDVEILFQNEGTSFRPTSGTHEISSHAARFDALLKLPELGDFFQKEGFSTHFKKGQFILAPAVFERIYKGALGETTGKFIFGKYLGWELESLPGADFEKFDFLVKDFSGLVVDFKFWNEAIAEVSASEELARIRRKMDKVGASKALIVNLLADGRFRPVTSGVGDVLEIPRLLDPETGQVDMDMLQSIQAFAVSENQKINL